MLFALCSVVIFVGAGGGIDLARAYAARQKLSLVATLACQYSTRPSVAATATWNYSGANGFQTYVSAVNAFATASLGTQRWVGTAPTGGTATPNSYFTATPAAGGSNPADKEPTNPIVEMQGSVPATFGQIIGLTQIPVHAKINCASLSTNQQIVNPPIIFQEGFEKPCGQSYCVLNPSGGSTEIETPVNTFPPTAGYQYNGRKWYIMGYCLEIDPVGVINPTLPEGSQGAELDCGNTHHSAGNSSISTSQYLEAGQYELRYFYRSRIVFRDYDPAYICGSTASDVSWANDINVPYWSTPYRTNQINVYLDANIAGSNGNVGSPPLHQTLDGTQYLAGSNLIDMCVYTNPWVERSVRFKVTSPGIYWLSFAADGASDSFGGQLDNIRLCISKCTGTPQDNFPASWLAANNGGVSKVLFEDSFESPTYSKDPSISAPHSKGGNLNNSTGTTVSQSGCSTSTYPAPPGWPCQPASGWATAPYNEVLYQLQGAQPGAQYITIDGSNAYSSGSASTNRLISRPFLLDPGYYTVSYNYNAEVDFSPSNVYGTFCTAAPGSGWIYPAVGTSSNAGTLRFASSITADATTSIVGVFMSHSLLVSTPITGGSLGSTTSYTNPDGTVSTTPTVPPDSVTWTSYNPNVVNPVIDTCGYADSFRWIARSVSIKITKPGFYWLTFSANGGKADGKGPSIDDVKLTALGSPYMSNPPTSPIVAIPVPDPQPDTSYAPGSYPGFAIVADPFTPPGADQ